MQNQKKCIWAAIQKLDIHQTQNMYCVGEQTFIRNLLHIPAVQWGYTVQHNTQIDLISIEVGNAYLGLGQLVISEE